MNKIVGEESGRVSSQLAVRALPPQIERIVTEEGLSERVVRESLNAVFAGAPVEQVAIALHVCARWKLDPLGAHVVVFKNQGEWRVFVTLEGRLAIAARHPDYAGVRFSEPEDVGSEIRVSCWVYRKSWKEPTGPVVGRALKERSKRDGGTFAVEWCAEIARARALRNALRIAFGLVLPETDAADPSHVGPRGMRDEQRRELFALAGEQGWDDDERRRRAGVSSFGELSEERAAALIAEWRELLPPDRDTPPEEEPPDGW
jgi:hypothetical protein